MALNVGMGSGRKPPGTPKPLERRLEHFEDDWHGRPMGKGSIVATPDGTRCRVVAMRDNGEHRVIEAIEGPDVGRRQVAAPRELRLLEAPPPRQAPEPPALAEPSGGPRMADVPDEVLTERGLVRRTTPTVVAAEMTPAMFPVRGAAAVVLAGGPFDGVQIQAPPGVATYDVPAAHPDPGPGTPDFVPARYRRTKKRDEATGLVVFAFDGYQLGEPAAAAAG